MASIACPGCGAALRDYTIEALASGGTVVGSGGIICPACNRHIGSAELRQLVPSDPFVVYRERTDELRRLTSATQAPGSPLPLLAGFAIATFPLILGLISIGEYTDFKAGLVGLLGLGLFGAAVLLWRHLLESNADRTGRELLLQGALFVALLAAGLGTSVLGVLRDNGKRGFYDRLALLGLGLAAFALVAIGFPLAHAAARRAYKALAG